MSLGQSVFEQSVYQNKVSQSTVDEAIINNPYLGDHHARECYVSDLIPASMMNYFETLFSYLPKDYIPNKAVYVKLKSDL